MSTSDTKKRPRAAFDSTALGTVSPRLELIRRISKAPDCAVPYSMEARHPRSQPYGCDVPGWGHVLRRGVEQSGSSSGS
jgi:hypothetical protein